MIIAVIDQREALGRQLAEEMSRKLPDEDIKFDIWIGRSVFESDFTGADAIFLSVNRMYEVEVGNKLMRLCPNTPLVVVSDNNDFGLEAFNLNARHYLTHPLTSEGLSKALERCRTYSKRHASRPVCVSSGEAMIAYAT